MLKKAVDALASLFSSAKLANQSPERTNLVFKSEMGFFEYLCKYGPDGIQKDASRIGMVIDPLIFSTTDFDSYMSRVSMAAGTATVDPLTVSTFRSWREKDRENSFTSHLVALPSDQGGFGVVGICFDKQATFDAGGMAITGGAGGELVSWVPRSEIIPGVWVGVIVAQVAPEIDSTGKVKIIRKF